MKRTIVALAALVMLTAVGSANASTLYKTGNFYGLYVETFQGPTAGTPIAGICTLTFDGYLNLVAGQSQCYIVNGSGACLQNVTGTYAVNSNGTGTITGTLAAAGVSCPSAGFNESFVIQQLDNSTPPNYAADNVLFTRTDAGAEAAGTLVPQSGGPFRNYGLLGVYDETISGTTGGHTFSGVCVETFNGAGSSSAPYGGVTGSCTLNIATISPTGGCNYNLSGDYGLATNGTGFNFGTLTLASGAGCASTLPYAEILRVLNGTYPNGTFSADEITSISFETGVIATGTYLPQEQ